MSTAFAPDPDRRALPMKKVHCAQAILGAVLVISVPCVSGCGGSSGAINRTIDDATITTRVKTALLNDPNVNAVHIDVNTAGGVVTLTGNVTSQSDEQKAVAVARRVSGVRDVHSQLKVGGQ
jgi:hyperosmotically inducible protein